ncbi:hypothetical protein M3O96_11195 [Aquiflexum sp. TKW24L]|uniref:hypothetical protein n=1 Tax=Aquiflexum sp. TKW24L TaxID=2942212 RepID=UPI0020BF10EA|nr:hypothetical protein [Aquiflexum sp. TKW24L]MCL6259660.1 hypothetical protein [Aquiflexum sp. TKW24L]
MKNILLFSVLFVATLSLTFAQITWNGNISSDWNTAANWTPANVPDANNEDVLINGAGTFQPTLPANTTIRDFTMSGGTLTLGGNTLTIRNSNTSDGTISNGEIRASNFNYMANMFMEIYRSSKPLPETTIFRETIPLMDLRQLPI